MMQYLALIPIMWLLTNIVYETFSRYGGHYNYVNYIRMSKEKDNSPAVKQNFLEYAKPHRQDHVKFLVNTYAGSMFLFISILVILIF